MGIYISDSIHGLTRLTEYEKNIIASVGFNRLHDVYQNSTVYLTYPSNRTKRFEHSIGTMRLCSEMFYNSISNIFVDASGKELIEKFYSLYNTELERIITEVRGNSEYAGVLRGRITKIPNCNLDSFQSSLIPSVVPDKYRIVHEILIQSIRAAALLHDIGHPPYSHVVERAMKAAYYSLEKKGNQHPYIEVMKKYIEGKDLHEVMGDDISKSILMGILDKGKNQKNPDEIMFEILVLESVLRIFKNEGIFGHLHRIIDNSLDGDRLDYVTRDPENSGMNNGSIDYNRIIMDMCIIMENNVPYFCVPLKAANAVEDFLKRRYDLYKNIICHHRVIKTDYLMECVVKSLIEQYCEENQPGQIEDKESIPFDISGLWAPLGVTAFDEKACILSQWNDSWLITVLKNIYYEKYHLSTIQDKAKYIISKQFAELLNNERNYLTIIKRSEDFKNVDDRIRDGIWTYNLIVNKKIKALEKKSRAYVKRNNIDNSLPDSSGFLSQIREIIQMSDPNREENNAFILTSILHRKEIFSMENIEEEVKRIAGEVCLNKLQDFKYLNNVVVFKQISPGVKSNQDIYFYDKQRDKRYALDDVSSIVRTLRTEDLFRPVFYLYILVDGDKQIVMDKKKELLEDIGVKIGEYFIKTIMDSLDELIKKLV